MKELNPDIDGQACIYRDVIKLFELMYEIIVQSNSNVYTIHGMRPNMSVVDSLNSIKK